MTKNTRISWIMFLIVWIALLFVPIGEFRKPGGPGRSVCVSFLYETLWDSPLAMKGDHTIWALAFCLVLIHSLCAAFPTVVVVAVYHFMKCRQNARQGCVLSWPEPSPHQWKEFLAGRDGL